MLYLIIYIVGFFLWPVIIIVLNNSKLVARKTIFTAAHLIVLAVFWPIIIPIVILWTFFDLLSQWK